MHELTDVFLLRYGTTATMETLTRTALKGSASCMGYGSGGDAISTYFSLRLGLKWSTSTHYIFRISSCAGNFAL